jgi:hypothetical protein
MFDSFRVAREQALNYSELVSGKRGLFGSSAKLGEEKLAGSASKGWGQKAKNFLLSLVVGGVAASAGTDIYGKINPNSQALGATGGPGPTPLVPQPIPVIPLPIPILVIPALFPLPIPVMPLMVVPPITVMPLMVVPPITVMPLMVVPPITVIPPAQILPVRTAQLLRLIRSRPLGLRLPLPGLLPARNALLTLSCQ